MALLLKTEIATLWLVKTILKHYISLELDHLYSSSGFIVSSFSMAPVGGRAYIFSNLYSLSLFGPSHRKPEILLFLKQENHMHWWFSTAVSTLHAFYFSCKSLHTDILSYQADSYGFLCLGTVNVLHLVFIAMDATAPIVLIMLRMRLLGVKL
jgi:hypothetical protein